MERQGNQNFPPVTLCRSGCGFYGNAQFEGMCSKCYKDALKRKNQNPSAVSGRASPSVSASDVSSSMAATLTNAVASSLAAESAGASASSRSSPASSSSSSSSSSLTVAPSVETGTPTVPSLSSSPATAKEAENTAESATGGAEAKAEDSPSQSDDAKEKKPKKNRCFTCKKKVGLTGFLCRCEGLFCSLHRYSDTHNCTFDYKEMAQEQIRKNNPVVVGDKIQKI